MPGPDRARRGLTDERDRGLLLELTSGVCRWRAELDACLEAGTRTDLLRQFGWTYREMEETGGHRGALHVPAPGASR